MGVFDVNQSARNFARNAHKHSQQQFHRFHVHNRQYQERLRNLTRAPRAAARPSVASGFPGDEDYQPSGRTRRSGRIVWALLVVLTLVIAGVALTSPNIGLMPSSWSGVEGAVREGTAWNVRGGPGMAFPPIAVIHSGQAVRVACLEHGWARLESPNEGAFVYAEGLGLNATPPPC